MEIELRADYDFKNPYYERPYDLSDPNRKIKEIPET